MTQINGIHPYADEFPMASEDELAELAESIGAVGLIQPITLTPDGLVLDGRNRLKACELAGVQPHFVERQGDDDEYKEFVIGVNTTGRRESMTVQIAAASVALILGHEKRGKGRWKRGTINEDLRLSDSNMKKALEQSGTVLDILGPTHLAEVRDGDATLNAKYEQARAEKARQDNAQRERMELARRQEREEEEARQFFIDNNEAGKWLADRPGQHKTLASAYAQYEHEHEELRLEAERRRREEAEAARVKQERIERMGRYLEGFITHFQTGLDMADHPERDEILGTLSPRHLEQFTHIEDTYLKGSN